MVLEHNTVFTGKDDKEADKTPFLLAGKGFFNKDLLNHFAIKTMSYLETAIVRAFVVISH